MESHDQDPTTPQPRATPPTPPRPRPSAPTPSSAEAPTERGPAIRRRRRADDGAAAAARAACTARATSASSAASAAAWPSTSASTRSSCASSRSRSSFAGGAGFLAYLAAWLLVPRRRRAGRDRAGAGRAATIAGRSLLVLAVGTVLPFWHGPFGGWSWGGPLVSLVVLGLAGLGRLVAGFRRASRRSGTPRRPAPRRLRRRDPRGLRPPRPRRRVGAAAGGGVIVAGVVIVAGLCARGGRVRRRRALADPPRARARAAGRRRVGRGLDVDGGVGDREYRPATASRGAHRRTSSASGTLVVDLRDADLPPATAAQPRDRRRRTRRSLVPARRVRRRDGARRRRQRRRVRPRQRRPRRRLARRPPRAGRHARASSSTATSASARSTSTRRRSDDERLRAGDDARSPTASAATPAATEASVARRDLDSRRSSPASSIVVLGAVLLLDRLDALDLRFARPRAAGLRGRSGRSCSRAASARRALAAPVGSWPRRWPRARRRRARAAAPCAATRERGMLGGRLRRARPPARHRPDASCGVAFVAAAAAGGVGRRALPARLGR